MKTSEIHKIFKLTLDKNSEEVSFGGYPAFLPEEIDVFLNQAYFEIISNKINDEIGFEGSLKRLSDLQALVKTDKTIPVELAYNNVLEYQNFKDDSNDRLYLLQLVLSFGESYTTYCNIVKHEVAKKYLKTYNNDPWIEIPVATVEDNDIKIYVDSHRMVGPYNIDITYIKQPEAIDSSKADQDIVEVTEPVIFEIINRAVLIALDNIESQRIQSKGQLNTLQE